MIDIGSLVFTHELHLVKYGVSTSKIEIIQHKMLFVGSSFYISGINDKMVWYASITYKDKADMR